MDKPQAIFDEMPNRFLPEKAGNTNAVIQFDLSGDDGGQWYTVIKDGACTVTEGTHDSPSVTVSMADSDFVDMINGKSQPIALFMAGKVKVQGDVMLANNITSWFDAS